MSSRDHDIVLVLSGGNALGAFQAGVYEALDEHGLHPDWIVGTSIGALNGALILGSAPGHVLATLRRFWRPDGNSPWFAAMTETARRSAAAGWTLAAGRPGLFGPLLSAFAPWTDDRPSLFETDQLVTTLDRLVDFDRLNAGPCRYTATALDLATGEDVVFDSRAMTIDARHPRASAALPVAYPAVEIDGRWLVDGGLSANLALDPVLGEVPSRPVLCIAVDLLPLTGALPQTIGEAAQRMQDLLFAAQSRRSIARWQADHAVRKGPGTTLVRVAYTDHEDEVAGKAMDFSGPSITRRWAAGRAAMRGAIARIADGTVPVGTPGLTVIDPERD